MLRRLRESEPAGPIGTADTSTETATLMPSSDDMDHDISAPHVIFCVMVKFSCPFPASTSGFRHPQIMSFPARGRNTCNWPEMNPMPPPTVDESNTSPLYWFAVMEGAREHYNFALAQE